MSARPLVLVLAALLGVPAACADDVLHAFEGDVFPDVLGWLPGACDDPCTQRIEDEHLVYEWAEPSSITTGYHYWIAQPPVLPPPSLWVEWRFRSNHPFGGVFDACDGGFGIHYDGVLESVEMYGDTAISFTTTIILSGLALDEFHSYRFESPDGLSYRVSVDGYVFAADEDDTSNGYSSIQLRGYGGCTSEWIPDARNEWDHVRFGTISFGEQVIATDPPEGFLDPQTYGSLDRFTVTYDSPNYVYIDDITVEVDDGDAPVVIQTLRLDNGDPETVEIVLDRPLPPGARTRFLLDDGQTVNEVSYTFVRGDHNADGAIDLLDFSVLQNCFGVTPLEGHCHAFDFDEDNDVGLADLAGFVAIQDGPSHGD